MPISNQHQVLLSLMLFIFLSFQSWGQTEVKIGGIVFPSFTTTERNQIVATDGQCIYNLSTDQLECYNGSEWKASATPPTVEHPWFVNSIGGPYVLSGTRIGIGTSAPAATVQIDSPADVDPFRARVQSSTKLRVHSSNGSVSVGTSSAGPENGLYVNGRAGIGTSAPLAKMTIADIDWQFHLNNPNTGGGNWYLGSSADAWAAGGGKFVLSPTNSSTNAALVVDASKNVGISNTSPSTRLHVSGGSDVNPVSGGFITVGNDNSSHIAIDNNEIMARNNGSAAALALNAEGGEVTVNSGGSRDADALEVKGRVYFDNGGNSGMRISATSSTPTNALFEPTLFEEGLIGFSGRPFWRIYSREFYALSPLEYRSYSDRSLKGNIVPINSALDKITKLEGVSYRLLKSPLGKRNRELSKEEKFVEANQLGFIAQDVAKVLPQLVTKDESSGLYTVAYMGVIPVLVEAIKEQQSVIELQEMQLQALLKEKEMTAKANLDLDKRLKAIEAQLSQSNAVKSGTN